MSRIQHVAPRGRSDMASGRAGGHVRARWRGVEPGPAGKGTGPAATETARRELQQLSGSEARVAYAQSAVIVRALFDAGGRLAIGALLQDLSSGQSCAAAFEQRFFQTYDGFITNLEAAH